VRSLHNDEALVIAGDGNMFCAGLDTAIVAAGDEAATNLLAAMGNLLLEILGSPRPIVVAADGHGIAARTMLMLCADYTIVADRPARYGFSEVPNGLPLPAPVVALIRSRANPNMTLRLAAHGEMLDASQAIAAGIADDIVQPDQVVPTATQHAARLALLPGESYRATKQLVNEPTIAIMRSS
jgi:enoyl-CoA hydratase